MVEIGATLRDCERHENVKQFGCLINMPPQRTWEREVVENFWKKKVSMARFLKVKQTIQEKKGVDVEVMLKDFSDFIKECIEITNGSLVIASDRIDQDNLWISHYLCMHGFQPLTKITGRDVRLLDLNSFFQGCAMTTHKDVHSFEKCGRGYDCLEAAFVKFGIPYRPRSSKTHYALEDSAYYAEAYDLIITYLNYFNQHLQNFRNTKPLPPFHFNM
jgi:hypothetical protein